MDWLTAGFLSLDTESTGIDTATDRVVTATVIHIEGKLTREKTWLVNPGVPIPPEATAVHGIDNERAQTYGRPPGEVVEEVAGQLGKHWSAEVPVLAFNASYDLSLLDAEMRRHLGYPLGLAGPVIDPLVLDRALDKWRKGKRTLSAACDHYGVVLSELDAHTSAGDALAAARVMWKIARAFPEVCSLPLLELHEWQAAAHRAWAENFGAYLARQGKPDDVDREWPMRTAAG